MNKNIKKLVLIQFLFLTILIWPGVVKSQYKLEKVKEFKINSFYQVDLIDYFSKEGLFLGYTHKLSKGMDITMVKENGEIVLSKNMKGEGPEEYTATLNCFSFSDKGDIWVLTPHQLLLYDQKLKLKERSRYESRGRIYLGGRAARFSYFHRKGESNDFSFITNPSGARNFAGLPDFRGKKLIQVSNIGKNTIYEIAPVSQRPQYEYLDKSLEAVYFPVYTVDNSQSMLYLTTSLDNEITVIDLNTNEVVSQIKITHGEFKSLEKK